MKQVHYLCSMKILMVCLGNICRSPLAQGILQKKADAAGLNWKVESAGTNGYHNGEAPHHRSQKVARRNGVDISGQVSRQFRADDFDKYDKIYAMADDVLQDMRRMAGSRFNEQKADYFLNILQPGQNKDIPDPWYGGEDGYIEVYELIDSACTAIIEQNFALQPQKQLS